MLQPAQEEAIQAYIGALEAVGRDPTEYQFETANGKIRLGHIYGGFTQWNMLWYSPEGFHRLAKRRRQNVPTGDPKKPF